MTKTRAALAFADPEPMEPLMEGYRYQLLASTLGWVQHIDLLPRHLMHVTVTMASSRWRL